MDITRQTNNNLPSDPLMLMSYVNTKLRDEYDSLEEFCSSTGIDCRILKEKLQQAGFEYNRENNKFW
ncbi:MAG: DUF4250 domain-containing protein [Bacteroidaceae bacterium]